MDIKDAAREYIKNRGHGPNCAVEYRDPCSCGHDKLAEALAGPVDTSNLYLVSKVGDEIAILRSVPHLSAVDAINLAAWLVALADPERETFDPLLKAVLET